MVASGILSVPASLSVIITCVRTAFELGEPFVALGVSDMRGLAAAPVMQLAGKSLEMEQGAQLNGLGQGLHAELDLRGAAGKPADAADWRLNPAEHTLFRL